MKISAMRDQDIMDRMGSLAGEQDAQAMRKLIARFDDSDDISDREWFKLAAEAFEMVGAIVPELA